MPGLFFTGIISGQKICWVFKNYLPCRLFTAPLKPYLVSAAGIPALLSCN
jgi:hypothetical protein